MSPTLDFSNDRPVVRVQDDRLNRAPFADRIAAVLQGLPNGTGLVVGIHGPWGDGKTTVLNLLRADLSADPGTVVRDFNPWRLTDDEAMLRGFFSVLAESIGASLSTRLERTKAGAGKTADVRRVLVDRIKSHAATGAPLFDPEVSEEHSLLFEWRRVEGRDPVQAHLLGVFERDPRQIGKFLQSQAPLGWGAGDVLPHVGDLDGNQLKNMKLLIDLDTLADLIRKHCAGDFENPEWFPDATKMLDQRLAEQFMHVYNKWKKDGEPPDPQVTNDESMSTKSEPDADDPEIRGGPSPASGVFLSRPG